MLSKNRIIELLKEFDPILVGTIPICIDIANSDLDLICYCTRDTYFENVIVETFGEMDGFKIWKDVKGDSLVVVANFEMYGFEIEIYCQNVPTRQQNGYRHMLIEHRLIRERGDDFRQRIVDLKRQGYKTEPSFCMVLGLTGNPYDALLKFE